MFEVASREKHFFPCWKEERRDAVIDMVEGSVGCKDNDARLTSWPPAVRLCILCHLIQSFQVALLAPGNQANPAVLSKLGNVPPQQFILLPVPAAALLAPIASLGSHSPKLFLYTMPFLVNLFLRKSAYVVLKFDLANSSYEMYMGTWLVGPWKGTNNPGN